MKTEPKKPTLETCARLVYAAKTVREKARAIVAARKHGYTCAQLDSEIAKIEKENAK